MINNSNELIKEAEKEMDIAEQGNQISLGSISTDGPQGIIAAAKNAAKILGSIVENNKLYVNIKDKKYVTVEGWTTLGALLGIVPCEVSTKKNEAGDWESLVELVRTKDGRIVGRASAMVGANERTWARREDYAKRSMAVTRATGKAFRLSFSFIMTLADYAPTPMEEMPVESIEVIKEIPVIIDRDEIKQGMLVACKQNGAEGMSNFARSLSPLHKKAFTRDEWTALKEQILEKVKTK